MHSAACDSYEAVHKCAGVSQMTRTLLLPLLYQVQH